MPQFDLPVAPERYDANRWNQILAQIEQLLSRSPDPRSIRFPALKSVAESQATGGGTASLGANSPASVLGAPYTWIKLVTADGTTVVIPGWKL